MVGLDESIGASQPCTSNGTIGEQTCQGDFGLHQKENIKSNSVWPPMDRGDTTGGGRGPVVFMTFVTVWCLLTAGPAVGRALPVTRYANGIELGWLGGAL